MHFTLIPEQVHLTAEDADTSDLPGALHPDGIGMKPFADNCTAVITQQRLKNTPTTLGCSGIRRQNRPGKNSALAGAERRDRDQLATVFVAERQQIERVLNRADLLFFEERGQFRPYSFDIPDAGLQILAGDRVFQAFRVRWGRFYGWCNNRSNRPSNQLSIDLFND